LKKDYYELVETLEEVFSFLVWI